MLRRKHAIFSRIYWIIERRCSYSSGLYSSIEIIIRISEINAVEISLVNSKVESKELDALLWGVLWKPLVLLRNIRESFKLAGECLELIARADDRLLSGLVANWTSPTEIQLRHLGLKPVIE